MLTISVWVEGVAEALERLKQYLDQGIPAPATALVEEGNVLLIDVQKVNRETFQGAARMLVKDWGSDVFAVRVQLNETTEFVGQETVNGWALGEPRLFREIGGQVVWHFVGA